MINLPNLITFLRLLLTAPAVFFIVSHRFETAFWTGIAAGITDFADGMAARLLHVRSRVGAWFDPLADKVFLTATFFALGVASLVPWWMVWLVFARDVFILAMAGYGFLFTSVRDFPPSLWGKVSTFMQILAELMIVANRNGADLPANACLWVMVVTTVWSGIHYGWRGWSALRSLSAAR